MFLSVGGGGYPSIKFSQMAASRARRSAFIRSVISMLRAHGVHGLDVDWCALVVFKIFPWPTTARPSVHEVTTGKEFQTSGQAKQGGVDTVAHRDMRL